MDLHLHTPASQDFQDRDATYLDVLRRAEEKGLEIIAFADHNTVAGYTAMLREIEGLELLERLGRLSPQEAERLREYRRLRAKILVLPGFELTATLGFHVLGIFSDQTSIRRLEHVLLDLNVPEDRLDLGTGEVGATTDVVTAYRVIDEAGGIVIAAHVNSSHGVAMGEYNFGGQTKVSFTQDRHLHALEVTDLLSRNKRNTAWFFSGVKPEYSRRMHCIQGSDAHRLQRSATEKHLLGVGDRATEVLLPEASFAALRELFLSTDFSRTRPHRPEESFDFIKAARKGGVSVTQTFYEHFPAKASGRLEIVRDVVAFANTNGGTIYIGAGANARAPIRGVEQPETVVEWIEGEVREHVTPPLELTLDVKQDIDRGVVVAQVPAGPNTPYAVAPGEIYLRQESQTRLASRDEIVRLVERMLSQRSGQAPRPVRPPPPAPEDLRRAAAAPPARAVEVPPVEPAPAAEVATKPAEAPAPVPAPQPALAAEPPKTGAEIVEVDDRNGVHYYTIRDLRNGSTVRNVTRASARHLWHYAIIQREEQPVKDGEVLWKESLGLWKTYRRSGARRYNLVQRDAEGGLHVYYGVTDDGLHGPWRDLVQELAPEETRSAEPEAEEPLAPEEIQVEG